MARPGCGDAGGGVEREGAHRSCDDIFGSAVTQGPTLDGIPDSDWQLGLITSQNINIFIALLNVKLMIMEHTR